MAPIDPVAVFIAIFIVVAIIFFGVLKALKPEDKNRLQHAGAQAGTAVLPQRARHRQRMVIRQDESEGSAAEDDVTIKKIDGKIGAKKMRKLQEKAEKKARREEMEQERKERKERERESEEKKKKEEEQKMLDHAHKEEEERRELMEKEKQEYEEYLKLKESFSVDAEGEEHLEDLSSESRLNEFIIYIKAAKVVMLEDLAAHFKLKTQAVIQRVQELQASGDLTGVIDDRGKFICITVEELESVAKFVKQHGRVSKADLAVSSNQLISLITSNIIAIR